MTSPMSYDDSPYPVRADLADAHGRAWERLSKAGTWLTGAERVRVMAEARRARDCALCARQKAALSPFAVTGAHDATGDLPENWTETIHRIVAAPGRLTHGWYLRTVEGDNGGGIPETTFVEIVSLIAHTTAIRLSARPWKQCSLHLQITLQTRLSLPASVA